MKKIMLSVVLFSLALIVAGCNEERFMVERPGPDVFEQMTPSASTEVALAEEVIAKRLAYRKELEKLKSFYEQSGNQLKLEWVQKELASIDSAPRYRYIIQAEIAGDKLVAKDSIPKANILYEDAKKLYKSTEIIPGAKLVPGDILISRKKMQLALNKCNDLIRDYPSSDKIDDAAYIAAQIHEFFKDYSIAVLYYKRTFQWDPQTPYPARYRAARLLDYELYERSQALPLYRESLQKEIEYLDNDTIKMVRQRVDELTAEPKSVRIQ
jgi:hypothetical protein